MARTPPHLLATFLLSFLLWWVFRVTPTISSSHVFVCLFAQLRGSVRNVWMTRRNPLRSRDGEGPTMCAAFSRQVPACVLSPGCLGTSFASHQRACEASKAVSLVKYGLHIY